MISGSVDESRSTRHGARPRGRLAPSPTGALHVGNARTFLAAWLSVRSRGGDVLLRMEDLDHPKVKREAAEAAMRDLRWLGLDWDEGPDLGGPCAPYVQSERSAAYSAALESLLKKGCVYPCTCARRDVRTAQSAPHAGDDGPRYPGTCRAVSRTYDDAWAQLVPPRLPAWRFKTEPGRTTVFQDGFHGECRQDVHEVVGDFVVARHPGGAGYTLAVVVDDAAMGVTEVLRADDLLEATHRQWLLYEALELAPPAFTHIPLVVGEDGKRLAKRHGDTRIADLRERGLPPERIVGLLAWSCGWAAPGESAMPRDLIRRFELRSIPAAPLVLDSSLRLCLGL